MLTQDQIDQYRRSGFALVQQLLAPEEVAMLDAEHRRLWSEISADHPAIQTRPHDTLGLVPDRIESAYLLSPFVSRLCEDDKLVKLASAALGEPAMFFKDKLISKHPSTHGYGLHQDWPYWEVYQVPADQLVSLVIAIDPADETNGALEVWPDELHLLPQHPDDPRDVAPDTLDPEDRTIVRMMAGDALLLHPLAPHGSGPNRSSRSRRVYTPTYVAARHASVAAARTEEERARLAVIASEAAG